MSAVIATSAIAVGDMSPGAAHAATENAYQGTNRDDFFKVEPVNSGDDVKITLNGETLDIINDSADTSIRINSGQGDDDVQVFLGAEYGDLTVYGGKGRDLILGGSGDDKLYGEAGDDYIIGGFGDDHLVGGTDADLLVGGLGSDTYGSLENDGEEDDRVSSDRWDPPVAGGIYYLEFDQSSVAELLPLFSDNLKYYLEFIGDGVSVEVQTIDDTPSAFRMTDSGDVDPATTEQLEYEELVMIEDMVNAEEAILRGDIEVGPINDLLEENPEAYTPYVLWRLGATEHFDGDPSGTSLALALFVYERFVQPAFSDGAEYVKYVGMEDGQATFAFNTSNHDEYWTLEEAAALGNERFERLEEIFYMDNPGFNDVREGVTLDSESQLDPLDDWFSWASDDCSVPHSDILVWIPGGLGYLIGRANDIFKNACRQHDFGYQNFGLSEDHDPKGLDVTEERKDSVDDHFYEMMKDECDDSGNQAEMLGSCDAFAWAYYSAVSAHGEGFFGDE